MQIHRSLGLGSAKADHDALVAWPAERPMKLTSQQEAQAALEIYRANRDDQVRMDSPEPKKRNQDRITHGMCNSPEYKAWTNMKGRCGNPKVKNFADYGGRGIKVCERWQKFENFYADMGPRPSAGHSIERKDNGGNYEPSNCKWATRTEQSYNKRSTLDLTGQSFGRLTVIERADAKHWKCRCTCGTVKIVQGSNLYGRSPSGKTRSCGCHKAEVNRRRAGYAT